MTKRISFFSTIVLAAALIAPGLVLAQQPNAIVHDIRGNQVKDARGNCVRTMYGQKDEECGEVAAAVAAPKEHTVLASVYFGFNRSDLDKKAKATLNHLLSKLRHDKVEAVTIAGYADAIGSDSYNLKLSEKRAAAVKKYLNAHGFKHTNVDVRALGKKDASASCKGMKDGKLHNCMQNDRRVDIELSVVK